MSALREAKAVSEDEDRSGSGTFGPDERGGDVSDTLIWQRDCPDGYKVQYWVEQDDQGNDVIQVQCVSMEEPPPPGPASGTTVVMLGDRLIEIDWRLTAEGLQIDDLDIVVSLD